MDAAYPDHNQNRHDTPQSILIALTCTRISIISEQGTEVAREFGANKRSVKTGSRVQEVFTLVLRGSMKGKWDKIVQQQQCVVT